jgi:hypothetical protein
MAHRKIRDVVAVEIAHGNGTGIRPSVIVHRWPKRAVSVTQQHADTASSVIGGDGVQLAVAVEVCDCHVKRVGVNRIINGWAKVRPRILQWSHTAPDYDENRQDN